MDLLPIWHRWRAARGTLVDLAPTWRRGLAAAVLVWLVAGVAGAQPPAPADRPPGATGGGDLTPPPAVAARLPAVVKVIALGVPERRPQGAWSGASFPAVAGSGVVVSPDCLIVTNHHVVTQGIATAVRVPGSRRPVAATLVSAAPEHDLAILAAERSACPEVVSPLDRAPRVASGMAIFTLGYGAASRRAALRARAPEVRRGAVSHEVSAGGMRFLQLHAQVRPGDSGGLTCDEEGRLVGVIRGLHRGGVTVGYAVPRRAVARVLAAAVRSGALARARERMLRPDWAREVVAIELAAELAEEPWRDSGSAAASAGERDEAVRQLLRVPVSAAGSVQLLAAAHVWNLAVARQRDPSAARRREACRLFAGARRLVAQARRVAPGEPPGGLERLVVAGDSRIDDLCDAAAAAVAPTSQPQGTGWTLLLGRRPELALRWGVAAYSLARVSGRTLRCWQAGAAVPVVAWGDLTVGLWLGYALVSWDHDGTSFAHRLELPLRLAYGRLFVESGLAVGFSQLAAEPAATWHSGAGFLARVGVRVWVLQVGVDYADLPGGEHRLGLAELFAGLVW